MLPSRLRGCDAGLSARFSEDDIKERYLWKESHLYTSDPSGLHFTNSLMNVAYTPQSYDDHMQLQPEVCSVPYPPYPP